MEKKISLSLFLRKTAVPILFTLYFLSCSSDKQSYLPSDTEESVSVSLSVQMSQSTFDTSTDIEPMQTKSEPEEYHVIKFTGQSTLLILKQKGTGWVVERRVDDLYPSLRIKNEESLLLEAENYVLRPGCYRFVLFANYRSGLQTVEEGDYIERPDQEIVISYGTILGTSNKMLLGDELFIGKTTDLIIGRTGSLDTPVGNRHYALELKRVVSMVRLAIVSESMPGSVKLGYYIENSREFYSGVNMFGDVVKTNVPISQIYGVTDIVSAPYDLEGTTFYWGSVANTITNRPRYYLTGDEQDGVDEYTLYVVQASDIDIPPLSVTLPLKRNTIGGVALLKERGKYSIYMKDGMPYPVNYFSSLGKKSGYIELNNGD